MFIYDIFKMRSILVTILITRKIKYESFFITHGRDNR